MNFNSVLLLVSLVFAVISGCEVSESNSSEGWKIELNPDYHSIIQLDSFYLQSIFGHFADSMQPATLTTEEVATLEGFLKAAMKKKISQQIEDYEILLAGDTSYQSRKSQYVMNLYDYGRIYTAAQNSSGRKVVYVDCFCGIIGSEKPTIENNYEWTQVRDGGFCYFSLFIDLQTGRAFSYIENGRA